MEPSPIVRRPATQKDVPFLMKLRQETMNPHLLASGRVRSAEEDLRRVLFRFDCAEIVMLANEAIGLLKVSRDSKDWYLIQIQLTPALQGRGLGTQLIQDVVDEARKANVSLALNVLKANPARLLYDRLGFAVVSETDRAFEMKLTP
jgi:GNAT superfamily N-acetyltransferase